MENLACQPEVTPDISSIFRLRYTGNQSAAEISWDQTGPSIDPFLMFQKVVGLMMIYVKFESMCIVLPSSFGYI
jgi:hypothetical protein